MMAHYFDDQPQVAHQIDEITVSLRGCTFTLKPTGVFFLGNGWILAAGC